jgi:IS5 family transposase
MAQLLAVGWLNFQPLRLPHVAQNTSGRRSAIDGRTTRHLRYALSQRARKRVEEIFGWMKMVGGFRRTRYRGLDRTGLAGYLVATAYNLVRMVRLSLASLEMPEEQCAQ